MRKVLLKGIFFLSCVLLANIAFAQDIIVLKNGDEISSKVLEVTPDLVKYKKWANQDGPSYSTIKAEVFMIKYENGTKDVFNRTPVINSNPVQSFNINDGSKYIGTWYDKNYNGSTNRTVIIISRTIGDYLVEFRAGEGDELFTGGNVSFREVGIMDGNSIVINRGIKLSLLNEDTTSNG